MSIFPSEVAAKTVQLLKELLPAATLFEPGLKYEIGGVNDIDGLQVIWSNMGAAGMNEWSIHKTVMTASGGRPASNFLTTRSKSSVENITSNSPSPLLR
jgi:hypothetical protein